MLYKTNPVCSPEVEAIVTRTIGCALRVHQALGPGFELKAVEKLTPVHQAQLISYLKAGRFKVGLLMNFHSEYLKSTLRRFVL
jgi:hypothetical protein